ncbi:YcxB family protein [Fimbriimonas ginsengisoli]|uniref:YcxB-like C-terminal domain-containing protein n=1 Tax=Fimbriimonas ginsengisoli Gsoil 348 TaxID=661478 RepID=A0A068NVP2_FIMGI|nr:YcxB family protein [Fimbriimonas ginsengisoli]AIE85659.1 hypothetical protein OP10G_2291 [Fimbriimonas ginsengisoli Gsoil 348]
METDQVALRPILSTDEQIRAFEENLGKLRVAYWLSIGVFGLFVAIGLYRTIVLHEWFSGAIAIVVGLYSFSWGQKLPFFRNGIHHLETRQFMEQDGLRLVVVINGKTWSNFLITWSDVQQVSESADAVVLRLQNGTQLVPNESFENEEQRALLISRAGGLSA